MDFGEMALIRRVRESIRKDAGVEFDVHVVRQEREAFIVDQLSSLSTSGHYVPRKITGPDYHYYQCERSRKKSGRSSGDPSKTRANSCTGFVSFKFSTHGQILLCTVKVRKSHTGHNISNVEEAKKNRLDSDMVAYMHMHFSAGKTNTETLMSCVQWSVERGYQDKSDRRFFPTPADVKSQREAFTKLSHHDGNDAISTAHLIASDLREEVQYHQPLHKEQGQPLIIVMQSAAQSQEMQACGQNVLFVDASYSGLTAYRYAVYVISVRNSAGYGSPVASFVVSQETTEILTKCFTELRKRTPFIPRAVMVDKDLKLVQAIKNVYAESSVLLCWFHVLQSLHRWLNTTGGGGLTGPSNVVQRKAVIDFMRNLKAHATETDFNNAVEAACATIPAKVWKYLKVNWFAIAPMWANFGRRFFHEGCETNNLSERMFLRLKYQFLRGVANRRLDDLLIILSVTVKQYFGYLSDLHAAGRMPPKRHSQRSRFAARELMETDVINHLTWLSRTEFTIPSASQPTMNWLVNMLTYECSCPASSQEGGCKHLQLGLLLLAQKEVNLESERESLAKTLVESGAYLTEENRLIVFNGDTTSIFDLIGSKCFCVASSQGQTCCCAMMASILQLSQPEEEAVEQLLPAVEPSSPAHPPKLSFAQMAREVAEWSESDQFTPSSDIQVLMERMHTSIFSNFARKPSARKITPLHPYRKNMLKQVGDHSYTAGNSNKKSVKRKTPNDFQTKSSSTSVKKCNRPKGIGELYSALE